MKSFYTPNCAECMGLTDSESIQNAVKTAKETGVNKVVIPNINERTKENKWVVGKAILLPDDIQIVLDNCYIVQETGTFDNIFRNENFYNEELRTTVAGTQRNIHINGTGNAVLDGGVHNGLTESTSNTNNMPHVRANNMILMTNVDGFSVTGIKMINQRWWANHFCFCCNGLIENITFDAKDDYPNQDGIDIRPGCNNITIKNIFGVCGDDVVALTGLGGMLRRESFAVEGKSWDIHHIYISNIRASSVNYASLALRSMDGILVHDITAEGIFDISDGKRLKPNTIVRIGQKGWSRVREPRVGDISRISIKNVYVNYSTGVMINVALKDSVIENIFCTENTLCAVTTSARSEWFRPGAAMENVVFDKIFCDSNNRSELPLIELLKGEFHSVRPSEITENMKEIDEYLKNVVIKNVYSAKENPVYSEFTEGWIVQ